MRGVCEVERVVFRGHWDEGRKFASSYGLRSRQPLSLSELSAPAYTSTDWPQPTNHCQFTQAIDCLHALMFQEPSNARNRAEPTVFLAARPLLNFLQTGLACPAPLSQRVHLRLTSVSSASKFITT